MQTSQLFQSIATPHRSEVMLPSSARWTESKIFCRKAASFSVIELVLSSPRRNWWRRHNMSSAVGTVVYRTSRCWSDANAVVDVDTNHLPKLNYFLKSWCSTLPTDCLASARSSIQQYLGIRVSQFTLPKIRVKIVVPRNMFPLPSCMNYGPNFIRYNSRTAAELLKSYRFESRRGPDLGCGRS